MSLSLVLLHVAFLLGPQQSNAASSKRSNNLGLPANKISVLNSNVQMPKIIYGSSGKPDRAADAVYDAVKLGFRGIDSALIGSYNETGVGVGLARLYAERVITRDQLFIQTKFSPTGGRNGGRMRNMTNPFYDPKAPIPDRVKQSLNASLRLLNTTYLDSIVLHRPMETHAETMQVWRTFESFVDAGTVLQIGLSNFYDRVEFERIYNEAKVKPSVVQNRFNISTGMDRDLRVFLREKSIGYQIYSALKRNSSAMVDSDVVKAMASKYKKTNAQVFLRFLIQSDITPLMGTASKKHMNEDLDVLDMQLSAAEVQAIDKLFP